MHLRFKKPVALILSVIMIFVCGSFVNATAEITTPSEEGLLANPTIHLDMQPSSDRAFVTDVSGNGFDATITGSPETVSGPDGDASALNFANNAQHLRINNTPDFSGDFAISVTFYQYAHYSSDQMLVIKRNRNADQRDFQLHTNSSNQLNFVLRNTDGTWTTATGRVPSLNAWHTAEVQVKDNVIYLYLDENLETTTVITKTRQATTTAPISIGADAVESAHSACAYISDVKIAVPDENAPAREYFAPTVTPDIYMEMDSANSGADSSENGYDATIKGTLTAANGYEGDPTALNFGYYTGMYFPDTSNMDFSDDYSVSVTFKQTSINNGDNLLVCKRKRSQDLREFQLYIAASTNKIRLILRNSSDSWVHCEGPVVTTDEWHTVVATVKDNVLQLYFDGVLANTVVNTSGRMSANASTLFIGADPEGGEGFVGEISEVKISDEAAEYPTVEFLKDNTAEVRTMEVGEYVFSDRVEDGYVWRDVMPDFFKGKKFNFGSIQGGTYTVVSGGLIYALTPDETVSGSAPQEATLQSYGFTRIEGLDFQSFGWSGINFVHVYAKQAMPGDCYEIGKWAVIVADDMSITSTDYVDNWANNSGEELYNGITLPEVWPPKNLDKYAGEMPVPYLNSKPAVININTGRQLFVDDFLIADTDLTRTWHKAEKYEGNPVMAPETEIELGRPTETNPSQTYSAVSAPFSGGVWYDSTDGLFKMWYNAGWHDGTALATSKDGITWKRDEYDVEPGTNLVIPHRVGVRRDSSAVIMDPFASITERFKMFLWSRPNGGEVYTSADGIHWGDPTPVASTGDRSTIFYNPFRNKWVYSIRSYWSGRARDYSESDDLIDGANLAGQVHWARVDNLDLKDPVINRTPELYNLDAVAYESVMLGSFSILLGPTNEECYEVGLPKITELHMGFSRDGFHWSRSEDRTPFIGATQSDTWDRGYLHSNAAICLVNDDELWFYYTAFEGNEEKKDESVYNSTVNGAYDKGQTGLATLRRDGFASMGTKTAGTLTTETVTFNGNYLFVNANAKSVKAEILDEKGNLIEGFSTADCTAVTGDTTKAMLSFGSDLSSLSGKKVKFRFTVEEGELYSFWVTDDAVNGASNGYLAGGSVGQKGLVDTAESYAGRPGDLNLDGMVDNTDRTALRKKLIGNETAEANENAADVNGDGYVNICDLVAIEEKIKKQ